MIKQHDNWRRSRFLSLGILGFSLCLVHRASADSTPDLRTDKSLYQNSIQTTKESIANDTLDFFYHDALENYHEGRYDDALQLLDKIYSINPHYEDVESLRETIHKKMQHNQTTQNLDTVKDLVRKGDQALGAGQRMQAISYWKQALNINPDYTPAKKKIQEVNQALAKKEFEAGYIHYHNGELEDALESWSNAIAMDPTYKERGLLLLMSKTELQVKKEQIARLNAQGLDQYHQGQLEDALHTYEELSALEPRLEDARRMRAKIKIQLGQTALKAAQTALSNHVYPEAIVQADNAMKYGYEVTQAQAIKTEADHGMQLSSEKKVEKKHVVQVSSPTPVAAAATPPPAPAQAVNPEAAKEHYRQGIAAIRKKDFHLAVDELDIAYQLDPTDERIYMARERAHQEWTTANAERQLP